MRILGIDPGLQGALALMDGDGIHIHDIPLIKLTKAKKSQTMVDTYELARIIDNLNNKPIQKVCIESVHAMPKQGVTSCFNFGKTFGIILGVVAANFIPVTLVTPQEWKRTLRVPADKDGARLRASQLMPKCSHYWNLKKHDGRAEAAMLAYWGLVSENLQQHHLST